MANTSQTPEVLTTEAAPLEAQGVVEVDAGGGKHLEPSALYLEPYQWVALAMVVLLGIMVWKKVPQLVLGGLDRQIAAIKEQLDEAKSLRSEAEALRQEYADKIAGAEKDAEAMVENARAEADAIVARAEEDSKAMIARRERMAQDKIAAAERTAVDEVREAAAAAAAVASRKLIAEKYDGEADKAVADQVIASL